jgi:hypothetical protein
MAYLALQTTLTIDKEVSVRLVKSIEDNNLEGANRNRY